MGPSADLLVFPRELRSEARWMFFFIPQELSCRRQPIATLLRQLTHIFVGRPTVSAKSRAPFFPDTGATKVDSRRSAQGSNVSPLRRCPLFKIAI